MVNPDWLIGAFVQPEIRFLGFWLVDSANALLIVFSLEYGSLIKWVTLQHIKQVYLRKEKLDEWIEQPVNTEYLAAYTASKWPVILPNWENQSFTQQKLMAHIFLNSKIYKREIKRLQSHCTSV